MDNNHLDPREIEADIEKTRKHMSKTLEEIHNHLSPNQLLDHTFEYMSDKLLENKNFSTGLTDTVKENPIAITLIGFGLGWLILSKKNKAINTNTVRKPKDNHSTKKTDNQLEINTDSTTDVAGRNKGTPDDGTKEEINQLDNGQTKHALDKLYEQPLVLIGGGLTLGAVLGIYLASSQHDNKLLKKNLDKKIDRVVEAGDKHLEKVKEAVISAAETINEAVGEVSNTSGTCEDKNEKIS